MSATPWIIIIPQTQVWNTLGETELKRGVLWVE
ncbi:hypothetical protein LINPERHAP2_LOCUS36816 [Linum perenne]